MLLKLSLFWSLLIACKSFNNASCEGCFIQGTYCCGTTKEVPCECHVGFAGAMCQDQTGCSPNDCIKGTCFYGSYSYECACEEGAWGRRCEHTDSDVAHLGVIEKELATKYCQEDENKECYPPHLQVTCDTHNLDFCDIDGNIRPFRKCPYPWYCFEAFQNGICDWECERSECLYDGFECPSNQPCFDGCLTEYGVCDIECTVKAQFDKFPTSANTTTILELSLNIAEHFWWDHKNAIIANISALLRIPLVYQPKYNNDLEKNRNSLENILSRGRRNTSSESDLLKVNFELYTQYCSQPYECTTNGFDAGSLISTDQSKKKSIPALAYISSVIVRETRKELENETLANTPLPRV